MLELATKGHEIFFWDDGMFCALSTGCRYEGLHLSKIIYFIACKLYFNKLANQRHL